MKMGKSDRKQAIGTSVLELKFAKEVGGLPTVMPAPWKISHSSTGGIQNPHL